MVVKEGLFVQAIEREAERELAAFTTAAIDTYGQSCGEHAAEIWLGIMELLPWPTEDHRRFFRSVTFLAIAQLVSGAIGHGMAVEGAVANAGLGKNTANRFRIRKYASREVRTLTLAAH